MAGQLIFYTHPMSTAESQVDAQEIGQPYAPSCSTTTRRRSRLPISRSIRWTLRWWRHSWCSVRVGSSAIGAWIG